MKKIISFIIILALTISLYVPVSAAETTIYYQDTYTTAAAHEQMSVRLSDFMANDGSYGVFYLYDNGANALGTSDYNKLLGTGKLQTN